MLWSAKGNRQYGYVLLLDIDFVRNPSLGQYYLLIGGGGGIFGLSTSS